MGDTAQKSGGKAVQGAKPHRAPSRGAATAEYGPSPTVGALGTLHAWAGNSAVSQLLGSGAPLANDVRVQMESRFGADFSSVRIHDDANAHYSATSLEANAYTYGEHIAFAPDRYLPDANAGKRLLAHELAHVVQQRRGGATPPMDAHATHESGADSAAQAFSTGAGAINVQGGTAIGVARDAKESYGDFYWTAFFANRAFATGKGVQKVDGWPIDPGLAEMWSKVAVSDEQNGGKSEAFRQFADAVKGYQRDKMQRKGAEANGVVDTATAEALRKQPITRVGVTTVDAPKPRREFIETVHQERESATNESLGDVGDMAVDVGAYAMAGGSGFQQRLIAAAMRGFVIELRSQLVGEHKAERFNARLAELKQPATAAAFAASYVAGLAAGLVSPVTDLFGLASLADVIPNLGRKLVEGAINNASELADEGNAIAAQIKALGGEMGGALVDALKELAKDPSHIFDMIESAEGKATHLAGRMGHGAAAEVVDLFESPWNEEKETKPDPGWKSTLPNLGDAVMNPAGAAAGTMGRAFEYGSEKIKKKIFTTPWSRVGFAIGRIIGMVVVQVLLLVFSEGVGTAITKISGKLGELAPFLRSLTGAVAKLGEAIAMIEEGIAALAKIAFKPLERFTKPLGELLERFAAWLRKLLGIAEKETAAVVTSATGKVGNAIGDDAAKIAPKVHAQPRVEPHLPSGTSAADDAAGKAAPRNVPATKATAPRGAEPAKIPAESKIAPDAGAGASKSTGRKVSPLQRDTPAASSKAGSQVRRDAAQQSGKASKVSKLEPKVKPKPLPPAQSQKIAAEQFQQDTGKIAVGQTHGAGGPGGHTPQGPGGKAPSIRAAREGDPALNVGPRSKGAPGNVSTPHEGGGGRGSSRGGPSTRSSPARTPKAAQKPPSIVADETSASAKGIHGQSARPDLPPPLKLSNPRGSVPERTDFVTRNKDLLGPRQRIDLDKLGGKSPSKDQLTLWEKRIDEGLRAQHANKVASAVGAKPGNVRVARRPKTGPRSGGYEWEETHAGLRGEPQNDVTSSVRTDTDQAQFDSLGKPGGQVDPLENKALDKPPTDYVPPRRPAFDTYDQMLRNNRDAVQGLDRQIAEQENRQWIAHDLADQMERQARIARDLKWPPVTWPMHSQAVENYFTSEVLPMLPKELRNHIRLVREFYFD